STGRSLMPEASRRTIKLDPDAGTLPEGLLLPPEHGGEVLAFLVEPALRNWAPSALRALARGWQERGRIPLIVDADFANPSLPLEGAPTAREGLSDVLFFGASVDRVLLDLPGESFSLVPAGTVVPDAAEAWAHDAWGNFLRTLRSRNLVVLLLLPADREGVVPLVARADRVFRIGNELVEGPGAHPLIHPASSTPAHAATPREDVDETTAASAPPLSDVSGMTRPDQGTLAIKPEQQGGALPAAGAPGPQNAPAPSEGARPISRRPFPWLLVTVILVLVLLAAAVWFGWIEIPGVDLPGQAAFHG
ncbi:MAG: hypothetical protein EA350_00680, partial [Gemmatimonadales bacterium]